MGIIWTGRRFSLDKYKQWLRVKKISSSIPDWARVCNGMPTCRDGEYRLVRGLDGKYYDCKPEWEVSQEKAAYL